jgi:integrase
MSVYRPSYIDPKTKEKKTQTVWWYSFMFDGRRIQESSKSARKTVAVEAEKNRRADLERTFNGIEDKRKDRIRSIQEVCEAYLLDYKARHAKSSSFAKYAIGHLKRLLGTALVAEINERALLDYQAARLREQASPKTINEELSFLLRILEERGDVIRASMRRHKTLTLKADPNIARAFSPNEKAALIAEAHKRRSPAIVPALMLALHAGMRDAEIRGLQWGRLDLLNGVAAVGRSKTKAGEGRTIPLNSDVLAALKNHAMWFLKRFGETRPEWFVFPFGQPQPTDPTKPVTTFKTVWNQVRKDAQVAGRWHDNRHTFITDLAESPDVSDETIRQLAGHVSKQMLAHYSDIRMEAKRRAVDALVVKPAATPGKKGAKRVVPTGTAKESTKVRSVN